MSIANRQPEPSLYDVLIVFNIYHSSICLRLRAIDDVNFSRSKPFRLLPVVIGPR